ncbi:1-acyl-sn-glycerol-3-phosphate acyltransferase [Flavobacterium sp. HXWNR69]|uniref:1-acyl-sn-glycerol-3-phosphate acyltransferase n=1 Tax=Flavobacterium fragile TaxID=2949085 RepID=A0ABT0TJ21_9FLAO|nr:1-acyl-sn-glycerol-3-phosphate acyltransferase [Flavobacterium sp. HXWNR69]MCL9770977.1 1-acyl-sn-glycerol-3-phosphate acyltransferase [Flavobacterium sp. HXWNR69]
MKQILYKFIFFKILGWKIEGSIAPEIKKCVMIVVPHTSWYDFFLGVFTRGIVQQEMNFVAKKELFVFPFNYYFKWMGGTPLNRHKNENKVDSIAKIFQEKEVFRLAIAPEGTRKKVTEWKTGFYFIAQKANVPIIPVAFDYGKKEVRIHEPFQITNNIEEDFKKLKSYYKGVVGKFPAKSFTDI